MKKISIPIPEADRLAALTAAQAPSCWLDSALPGHPRSRFSAVVFSPLQIVRREVPTQEPFALPPLLSVAPGELPFVGGWVGFTTYEFFPPKPGGDPVPPSPIPQAFFMAVDSGIVIDHAAARAWVFCCAPDAQAERRCAEILRALESTPVPPVSEVAALSIKSNFSRQEYLSRVREIREAIFRGDCYQVNLSQRFTARGNFNAAQLYLRLREAAPAPQMAFFNGGDFQLLSASPETLLAIDGERVVSYPIKGTRPRRADPDGDRAAMRELLSSEKDAAELLMIVDLVRNDLGKICRTGSVRVPSLKHLESFKNVHHLVAEVEGLLQPGQGAWEALQSVSPGGSITGTPKIKAMELIRGLETESRGIYTGSIGYVGWDGRAAFNIAIRSAVLCGDRLEFAAGGGIVADSDPEAEYEETLHKARGFFQVLGVEGKMMGESFSKRE